MDSMEEEEDTMISTILTEIEETLNNPHPSQPSPPLSLSTLQNLQSLLNNNPNLHDHLFKSLSPSTHLLPSLTSTMDSSHTFLSLHSSNTYLSLLLLPDSPIFTLFTPISFLSLLRSLRRSLKVRKTGTDSGNWDSGSGVRGKRRKGKALKGNVEMSRSGDNDCFDGGLFMSVVEKLGFVLDLIHLNRFPDSLKSLVSTVAEIPVLAMEFNGSNGVSLSRLWELCSGIFRKTLKLEHGEEGETAVEILKALSPLILMGKSQARSFALGFVRNSMLGLSDVVRKAVVNLPRYLVHKAPEKAEPRAMAVEAIVEIVRGLHFEDRIGFVEFVVKISQGKADLRILGVDLSLNLVMSLKDPFGFELDHESEHSCGFKCLEALIQRCSDVNAVIRARALSNLSQLVSFLSHDVRYREVLKRMLGYGEMERTESEKRFNLLLRKRCTDEKANVRRAALVLINKLMSLSSGNIDQVVLKAMGVACSDPLVSIRKAAILALSEAFRTFSSVNVTTEWLHSVPRLITDNESSIQAECENLFLELVLDRITLVGSSRRSQDEKSRGKEKDEVSFCDGIATLLKEICNGEVAPWVKKICTNLGKQKRLKPKVAGALQNIIRTSELQWLNQSLPIENWTAPPGAWFLLSEVSGYLSEAVDWEFLEHHWQLLDTTKGVSEFNGHSAYEYGENSVDSNSFSWAGDRVFLLQTISNVSVDLPPEPAADLAHKLLIRIEEFKMHLTEVNAHVKALRTLCKQKASNPSEADGLVVKWVKQVLSKALRILEKYISEVSEENKENNFFTTPQTSGRKSKKRQATISRMLSQAVVAVYTIGSLVIVCPSADMSEIVPVMHRIITSGNSDPKLSKLPGSSVSIKAAAPPLYIQAWLTMGKICLADGKLAKSYIPLFVQELEKSESAALRNNLVVIMADFCVRYTALVDCYISKITKCLCDPCELVRRQTFILLSRLLQRDYVKWRGVLFLRFLLSLVDESEKIRQLADFLFGNILRVKAPLLAYNSFVEAVFVLNDCNTHNGHNGSKMSKAENRLFSIRGSDESSRSKRMHIYTSLLKQMAPEHLLATFAKLCAEILASASDGILNIDDVTGKSVLQDTFEILASKEMRIQAGRGSQNDAGDIDVEGSEGDLSAAAAAKGRAITQAVRKGLIQNTIPVFIELKWLLESKNSSLTGSLMECLRVLLKDYKNEIDEMLVADKQLQKELIYDMQKYESNKVKSTAAATMQIPNSFCSPMNPKNDKSTENLQSNRRVASAIADAAAAATARSVLREWNKGGSTPPLSSIKLPRLNKSSKGVNHPELQSARQESARPLEVLESLRRQCFMPDDEH